MQRKSSSPSRIAPNQSPDSKKRVNFSNLSQGFGFTSDAGLPLVDMKGIESSSKHSSRSTLSPTKQGSVKKNQSSGQQNLAVTVKSDIEGSFKAFQYLGVEEDSALKGSNRMITGMTSGFKVTRVKSIGDLNGSSRFLKNTLPNEDTEYGFEMSSRMLGSHIKHPTYDSRAGYSTPNRLTQSQKSLFGSSLSPHYQDLQEKLQELDADDENSSSNPSHLFSWRQGSRSMGDLKPELSQTSYMSQVVGNLKISKSSVVGNLL